MKRGADNVHLVFAETTAVKCIKLERLKLNLVLALNRARFMTDRPSSSMICNLFSSFFCENDPCETN